MHTTTLIIGNVTANSRSSYDNDSESDCIEAALLDHRCRKWRISGMASDENSFSFDEIS